MNIKATEVQNEFEAPSAINSPHVHKDHPIISESDDFVNIHIYQYFDAITRFEEGAASNRWQPWIPLSRNQSLTLPACRVVTSKKLMYFHLRSAMA